MVGIGLKRFKYAKLNDDGKTYGPVKTIYGAIECKVTLDLAEATLYCDDAIFAELLGKTVDEETGVVTSNVSDEPIYVGFGHIVPKMVNGAKKYKVEFFPKMKFKPFIANAKTKGDNLEFTTPSVEATIFENDDGDWEKHKVYDTENDANSALEGFFVPTEVVEE